MSDFFEQTDSIKGLCQTEAEKRLVIFGKNSLNPHSHYHTLTLFLEQFKSPLILLLIVAAILSYVTQNGIDALIILVIVFLSTVLGFYQEYSASKTVKKLLEKVKIKATVLRDTQEKEVLVEEVVPGDIVILHSGDIIPADGFALESRDLFVNESTLSGEPFPVEKTVCKSSQYLKECQLSMGTFVVGGFGRMQVLSTGKNTNFGKIAQVVESQKESTEFERGIARFSMMIAWITFVMTFVIFAANVYLERPFFDALLFALALAVGIAPELLPAIVSVNLSFGAKYMAQRDVIVKRLASIENLGSMDILCSDKTGTLTEGDMQIANSLDADGLPCEALFRLGAINAAFESGYKNPMDEAIRKVSFIDLTNVHKLDEIPFDFLRKRLSVLVSDNGMQMMIVKGAVQKVLEVCTFVEINKQISPIALKQEQIQNLYQDLSAQGYRIIAIASKEILQNQIHYEDEKELIFKGFILFEDPIKKDVIQTIEHMTSMGVELKILTGDNRYVSAHLAQNLGISKESIMSADELKSYSQSALGKKSEKIAIFCELEPLDKAHIVRILSRSGHVVGFIGDGVNDLPALHEADVGISVDNAVDVAKEAADIILMRKSLKVLIGGIIEGRKTFINTMKYIFMTTSANFGNIISMAVASLFIPFLPMLPIQVLVLNLLSDLPVMTIPTDNVDKEWLIKPKKWNLNFIKRFMIVFGLLSSVFDFITFFVLLSYMHANPELFRSEWFIVSLLTELSILWILRTRKPFFKSRGGKLFLISSLLTAAVALVLPFTPFSTTIGLVPLSAEQIGILLGIVLFYSLANEITKRIFYHYVEF